MEYDKIDNQPEYDEGYSEKQSALDTEIQAGGWKNLKQHPVFQQYPRKHRIFLAYQALSNKLFSVIADHLQGEGSEKLLTELKKLRMIQDILLNCLLWEHAGQLEKDMVPEEVWKAIGEGS